MLHDTAPAPPAELPGEPEGDAGSFKGSFQAARKFFPSFGIPGMRCLSQDRNLSAVSAAAALP